VPFHNRCSQSSKQMIGSFSEVLPVRVTLAEDENFASFSKKFSAKVRKTLRCGQHSVTNPIFKRLYEVTLNYHVSFFSEFAGISARPEWIHNGHGDESLGIQIRDFGSSNSLAVDFDLREGIFDEQDGARVVDHFFRVLDAFLFDSGQAVRRLSLTSPQETQRPARNGIRLRLSRQCSPVFVACLKNKPGNNRMPWPSFKQTSV
jgi:non-ribosomal peptide synthetase component F